MAYSSLVLLGLFAVASLAAVEARPTSDSYHRDHVRFHFFSKDTAELKKGSLIHKNLDKQNILASGFNPSYPTKVLIHGFSNDVLSDSMQLPKNAYFTLTDEVNVIIVDWSDLNHAPFYLAGFGNINGVATRVAELLDYMQQQGLVDLAKVHVIGHSLGAHVAGVTGEHLVGVGSLGRITGLDPAKPLINMVATKGRLSQDDAKMVDAIHTNAGTLGEQTAVGHVDAYPNGGKWQPGCDMDFVGSCSHGRSYYLFTETINNPKALIGWKCADEWDALHKRCESNDVLATIGEHLDFKEPGSYYLDTTDKSPFTIQQ